MAAKPIQSVEKYIYVSEPADALKCPICLAVAEEPWQHGKCGKLFCDYCIEKYGKHKPCPYCKKEQPQYFEDSKSKERGHRDFFAYTALLTNFTFIPTCL